MLALSMCPLEEEAPPRRAVVPQKQTTVLMVEEGETECNYVVLFFIIGVIVLALLDAM